MTIQTYIQWVINLRCVYNGDSVDILIENVVTGAHEKLAVVRKVKDKWPTYDHVLNTCELSLKYNRNLAWQIAKEVCCELRVPYIKRDPLAPVQKPVEAPIVIMVPVEVPFSSEQLKTAAQSASSHLACITA